MTKYVFITGGVVSSLGKGIISASLGRLLKNRGLKVTVQKFDPYINVDPGTMNPYQHGEVFVTDDGAETDLDLGHYERFIDNNLNKYSNVTTGKIYSEVIHRERKGEYLGATVQVIPHITNMIKEKITRAAKTTDSDVIITEIGGTVGDIESLPFLEAIRQMKLDVGSENVVYIHTTLIPYLRSAQEMKTKPTQHSVKELRSVGIQPNILVVRTEQPITVEMKNKISLFCDVDPKAVIESRDVPVIYSVPLMLQKQGMDQIVCDYLHLNTPKSDMSEWEHLNDRISHLKYKVKIALIGKYVELKDAYISVYEALKHAGYSINSQVEIKSIQSEDINNDNVAKIIGNVDGIIVPGGFGGRGIEGMLSAIQYARENDIPYLGVCYGLQMAAIEFARNVVGLKGANTTEVDPGTKYPVISLMPSQNDVDEMGGTLRLGAYPCKLKPNTIAYNAYNGQSEIRERHRHRFEFNNKYREDFISKGMVFSGTSPDDRLVEIMEYPKNKFFVGTQYHPEFLSRPQRPEGLYKAFISAAFENSKNK